MLLKQYQLDTYTYTQKGLQGYKPEIRERLQFVDNQIDNLIEDKKTAAAIKQVFRKRLKMYPNDRKSLDALNQIILKILFEVFIGSKRTHTNEEINLALQ